MRESIDKQEEALVQQGEALKVQSDSLKAQIEELQQSREESSKQTEEFFIQNMNVKLDRYYKLLDEKRKDAEKVINLLSTGDVHFHPSQEGTVNSYLNVLEFLYEEILVIKETYPHAFKVFIGEFAFRIQNDKYIRGLYLTYRDRFECKAFDLL